MILLVALLSATFLENGLAETVSPTLLDDWGSGFKMRMRLQLRAEVKGGWTFRLKFSKPVKNVQIWQASIVSSSPDEYKVENMSWNPDLTKCGFLEMDFMVDKVVNGESAPTALATFTRKSGSEPTDPNACGSPPGTTAAPPGSTNNPALTNSPRTSPPGGSGEVVSATLGTEWTQGFSMNLKLQIQNEVHGGWELNIAFSIPVSGIDIWSASFVSRSADGFVVTVENLYWNAHLHRCTYLDMPFNARKVQQVISNPTSIVTFIRKQPANGEAVTVGGNTCAMSTLIPATGTPTTTSTPVAPTAQPAITTQGATTTSQPATTEWYTTLLPITTPKPLPAPYNYDEVLHKSILFYEAQRSGTLRPTNRVSWRRDSALGDQGENGEDLTGGWYDAGDYVKFGFPMASSVTVLAWGLIQYRSAYQAAGELDNMLDCIKWPLDYFIKAHTAKFEFYGQVGDGNLDHAYWGRPEDMTMARPAWKITTAQPGSDLAAETAAAMAAGSIAFQQTDPNYAATLIRHAEELYEFADTYRGKYSDAIPNAAKFYASYSGYEDELVWGAAWLYKATNDPAYLTKAEQYYTEYNMDSRAWAFSWDDKKSGAQLLMTELTGKEAYRQDFQASMNDWLPGGGIQYTPKGLAWRIKWGALRYSANSAFLALVAADLSLSPVAYRQFAKDQISYMLGGSGRSYVVGFGANPPQKPHHASSSCPLSPKPCTWDQFSSPRPNPQVLYGALVGGPDENDHYEDDRTDYIKNEVTTDYNAGFQSAVAGLRSLL